MDTHSRRRTPGTLLIAPAVLAFIAALALTQAGCNTTEGVGEDISAAGDAIDDAAEDAN